MNIFKKKKSAKQISEVLADALNNHLESPTNDTAATLNKRLDDAILMLNGSATATLKPEDANQLSSFLQDSSTMYKFVTNLNSVPFEARKSAVAMFNSLVSRDVAGFVTVYCMGIKEDLLHKLVFSIEDKEISLLCGSMLRQLIKNQEICKEFLYSKDMVLLDRFFNQYLTMDNSFDISSDAFATFRDAVTLHKPLAAQFMEEKYADFFTRLNALLVADSYVTQRQSLKLLSEVLLQRANYRVMKLYIGDKNNLKLVMNLLRVKSKAIRVETFHVFKVFVANPNKTPEVASILYRNRDKLIQFLASFEVTAEAEQMNEEKALLIKSLQSLSAPDDDPKVPAAASSEASKDASKTEIPSSDSGTTEDSKAALKAAEETIDGKPVKDVDNPVQTMQSDAPIPPTHEEQQEASTPSQDEQKPENSSMAGKEIDTVPVDNSAGSAAMT